jgi:hypothetical protein
VAELVLLEASSKAVLNICKPERIKPVNYLSISFVKANERMLIDHLAGRLRLQIDAGVRMGEALRELRPVALAQKDELLRQAADTEVLVTNMKHSHERELAAAIARGREDAEALKVSLTSRLDEVTSAAHAEVSPIVHVIVCARVQSLCFAVGEAARRAGPQPQSCERVGHRQRQLGHAFEGCHSTC